MCSSLLSSQAGHPPKHPSAGETFPQWQQALLRVLAQEMRPWVEALLWQQLTWSWRVTLCCLIPSQSMLRPQLSSLGSQNPSPPPRPHSPLRGLRTPDSPSQTPPLPAALWIPMLKKRRPVRRQCGQKVIRMLQFFSYGYVLPLHPLISPSYCLFQLL